MLNQYAISGPLTHDCERVVKQIFHARIPMKSKQKYSQFRLKWTFRRWQNIRMAMPDKKIFVLLTWVKAIGNRRDRSNRLHALRFKETDSNKEKQF